MLLYLGKAIVCGTQQGGLRITCTGTRSRSPQTVLFGRIHAEKCGLIKIQQANPHAFRLVESIPPSQLDSFIRPKTGVELSLGLARQFLVVRCS
jgi:hypothetical protein